MEIITPFGAGFLTGIFLMIVYYSVRGKDINNIAANMANKFENQRLQDQKDMINHMKESFDHLSLEALSRNSKEFLLIANEVFSSQTKSGQKDLEEKKVLIDHTLKNMKEDLQKVEKLVVNFEKDRENKYGELSMHIKTASEQTMKLQETTTQLKEALSNTKIRGQWGERMAEDVLRLAGFVEGINYRKQKTLESGNTRPDYTFFLPQDLKVNMDVKFPLNNYLRYLEGNGDFEKEQFKRRFLKDMRERIKEVKTRNYINPEDNTVDYVIIFIPNEQVYSFIHENDRTLLDEALQNKVILSSPLTLYAILAVIRQSVDNFNLDKTAAKILSLLESFRKQWESFVSSFEKIGKRLEEAQKEYQYLVSTRRRLLEHSLQKIDDLRTIQRQDK